MEKKWCPFAKGKCKGEECQFYVFEEMVNTRTGEKMAGYVCLFTINYHLLRMNVEEAMRLQSGMQHFLSQTYVNALALASGEKPPALSGKPEVDWKVIRLLEESLGGGDDTDKES